MYDDLLGFVFVVRLIDVVQVGDAQVDLHTPPIVLHGIQNLVALILKLCYEGLHSYYFDQRGSVACPIHSGAGAVSYRGVTEAVRPGQHMLVCDECAAKELAQVESVLLLPVDL